MPVSSTMVALNFWSNALTIQIHRMKFPLSENESRKLRAGDQVVIDGEIIVTAGLPTHQRLIRCLDGLESLPFDLHGQTLFHLGSYCQAKVNSEGNNQLEVVYINPTTSTRFNDVMPRLISELQLHAVGGKGGLDARSVQAMREIGSVYLSFLGGGATLHTQSIQEVLQVGWSDMLMHYRLMRLRVMGLGPVTVAIDAHGNSTYHDAHTNAQARMDQIMTFLDGARDQTPIN